MQADGLISETADQVIVNDYLPGQGIAARKSDHGQPRTRRLSLTFRKVTL